MNVQGVEVPVEAASDETDGLVVVKQRGTFAQCPVADLHSDPSADDDVQSSIQITGNQPDPSTNQPTCPSCGEPGQFVPPNWVDSYRRVLKATFRCPNQHQWTQEYNLK